MDIREETESGIKFTYKPIKNDAYGRLWVRLYVVRQRHTLADLYDAKAEIIRRIGPAISGWSITWTTY